MKTRISIFLIFLILISSSVVLGAAKGDIQISAEPGLLVYIDGEFFGKTSKVFEGLYIENLNTGQHTVKVVKKGFNPRKFKVNIKAESTYELKIDKFTPKLNIKQEGDEGKGKIEQETGKVIIRSIPIDCKININSQTYNKEKDKFIINNLPYGKYDFTFIYKDIKVNYSLEHEYEKIILKVDFRKQKVIVEYKKRNLAAPKKPLNSNLMVNVPAGSTSKENGGINLDYHIEMGKYEVTMKDYITFLNDLEVSKDGYYNGKN